MMADVESIRGVIGPIVLLLALGAVAVMASRVLRLRPVVGYLALGLIMRALGYNPLNSGSAVSILAELGVVFLLFDIGLHFSFAVLRDQYRTIFGFGPLQMILGTLGLGTFALLLGLKPGAAYLVGATLALSSTAVVANLIAERHQQNCPVGLTATVILVFQDIAAILILIVANALGSGEALLPSAGIALATAALAFMVAVSLARLVVRPFFDLIVRSRNEEIFTAVTLLIALTTGLATASVGLSMTLGGFLGGMIVSDTPYRAIIQSEIKPFRGLLLSFFFISVGLSIDVHTILGDWPMIIGVTLAIIAIKLVLNAVTSLIFRWSVPGSTQLGFLLAQGSEFSFAIFSLPAVRTLLGRSTGDVLIVAVALTLAVTPSLAEAGRVLAGLMRSRRPKPVDLELVPHVLSAPVLVVGMGRRGRTVADGLAAFGIDYAAIDGDERRFREAVADGYNVMFGDMSDARIWRPMAAEGRKISVLTEPSIEVTVNVTPFASSLYPDLTRLAAVADEEDAARFGEVGVRAVIDRDADGIDLASAVLKDLGVEADKIATWANKQRMRDLALPDGELATAVAS